MWTNYSRDADNIVFISSMNDLEEEIIPDHLGREFVFLKLQIYCPECDDVMKKSFIAPQKAQDYANKHSAYKKYQTHNPIVRSIPYDYEFTISDVAGTQANIDKLRALKLTASESIVKTAQEIIPKYAKTIEDLSKIFGMTYTGTNIDLLEEDGTITSIKDIKLNFTSATLRSHLGIEDLVLSRDLIENRKEIYNDDIGEVTIDGFKFDCRTVEGLWSRATSLHYRMKPSAGYSSEKDYSWEFAYDLTPMVGHDTEKIPDCAFCEKPIEEWIQVIENIHDDGSGRKIDHKMIHRECSKHVHESSSLFYYAEKLEQDKTEVTA